MPPAWIRGRCHTPIRPTAGDYTVGYEELAGRVAGYTPEWASEQAPGTRVVNQFLLGRG